MSYGGPHVNGRDGCQALRGGTSEFMTMRESLPLCSTVPGISQSMVIVGAAAGGGAAPAIPDEYTRKKVNLLRVSAAAQAAY